ncbi:MAG TPA: exopolysaccharide biosynthesis polyprenyl glycosylphosphotransferase [Cyclobacteriaceae bacterium]|nr:exopolysaccharide biosynthesis polyprenyl glycosylphosphotransferase [Cyclobacteriaceae bacterium]
MSGSLQGIFFLGDILLLNLSIIASLYFGDSLYWLSEGSNNVYLLVFSNLAWLFLVMVSTPYRVTRGWSISKILRNQLAFVFIHLLVLASLVFFFRQHYSVRQISIIYALFIPLFFAFRVIALYLRKLFTTELSVKNYVILGRNDLAYEVRRFYMMNADSGYRFKGFLEFDNTETSIDNIRDFCVQNDVQEIFCCVYETSQMQTIIQFGLNSLIKVRIITNPPGSHNSAIQLGRNEQQYGIDHSTISLDDSRNQVVKRIFDLGFSLLFCLTVMWWFVPIIGLIIVLDSRGPVFFVQLRSGRGNRPFKCMKFRTMVVNVDADSRQASKNDTRITKLGHFLRRTSIDELPQFFNVLIGTMSVVGPRPHMLRHTDEYSKLIDQFMGRHYVKPGITGLAQCMGYRGETRDIADMENRVRMDRYYIENWTFWLDIKIIFLTVISLIRGSDKAF